jgi:2-polyprenyl-3-methyl-5-hydroxy-6-metoxy-1,4-benzoquinol methylase
MISLAARICRDEQMDDPGLDPEIYADVLQDLARVNAWTMTARPTLSFLARGTKGMKSFRLIDVGFGHGDMLRRIARWARRRGIAADLIGVDLNPNSAAIARAATPRELPIEYRTGDYNEVAGPVDFVISSLVAHHMGDEELRAFVRFMDRRASKGWIINDLHRSAFAYYGFPLLARLLFTHRIVRQDGQVSIGRAFRPDDWSVILRDSGLRIGEAKIVRRFPFRLCVEHLH